MLSRLNLPPYEYKLRSTDDRAEIFDPVRKLWIALTPEEWVRQHFINYLLTNSKVPPGLIAIEKQIKVNRLARRCDIIIFRQSGNPVLIVECKAPQVNIGKEALEQALRYNLALNIDYLVLTNGLVHYCFKLDYAKQAGNQLNYIPSFKELDSG